MSSTAPETHQRERTASSPLAAAAADGVAHTSKSTNLVDLNHQPPHRLPVRPLETIGTSSPAGDAVPTKTPSSDITRWLRFRKDHQPPSTLTTSPPSLDDGSETEMPYVAPSSAARPLLRHQSLRRSLTRSSLVKAFRPSFSSLRGLNGSSDTSRLTAPPTTALATSPPQPQPKTLPPSLKMSATSNRPPPTDSSFTPESASKSVEVALSSSFTSDEHDAGELDARSTGDDEDEDPAEITGIVSTVWRRSPDPSMASLMENSPLSSSERESLLHHSALARLDGLHRAPHPSSDRESDAENSQIPAPSLTQPSPTTTAHDRVQPVHISNPIEAANPQPQPSVSASPPRESPLPTLLAIPPSQIHTSSTPSPPVSLPPAPQPQLSQGKEPAPPPPSDLRPPVVPQRDTATVVISSTRHGRRVRWADAVPDGTLAIFYDHASYMALIDSIRERRLEELVAKVREQRRRGSVASIGSGVGVSVIQPMSGTGVAVRRVVSPMGAHG
ncbi:hypothetical protein DFJ73DRAFT_847749 [Zopfochytrium polystomum]|nr:hypothetical protein DFJ73DRAFT_847749 [Zopfochytrium polystomum]